MKNLIYKLSFHTASPASPVHSVHLLPRNYKKTANFASLCSFICRSLIKVK